MPRTTVRLTFLALLLCGTAQAATPDTPASSVTLNQSIEASVRDAQAKRLQKDYAGAVHVLSQLMMVAPDDARVVSEYGKTLIQQGRSREALDFLQRAAQLQQGDWTVYSALGVAYDQAGDYVSARSAYERALVLKPGETTILNNYAMSRALAGDLSQAKSLITQASAGSQDERIARNLKMIDGLTPVAASPAPSAASAAPTKTAAVPAAKVSNGSVVMQAIPADPKAGKVAKAKPRKPTATAANTPAKKTADGIPALRLANDRP